MQIAPQFDLFYTQHAQALGDYGALDIRARRCDPATDPELYRPGRSAAQCDVLYYGKWTPYRDRLLSALSQSLRVRVHAYAEERRWSLPALPSLDTPEALCAALNGSRLSLETALLDDAEGKYRNAFRITPRAFFAASCGVPSLVESFPGLSEFFEPGVEIATFDSPEEVVAQAHKLLADETARGAMGRRARQRVLRDHTWDRRLETFILDVRQWRAQPHPKQSR